MGIELTGNYDPRKFFQQLKNIGVTPSNSADVVHLDASKATPEKKSLKR